MRRSLSRASFGSQRRHSLAQVLSQCVSSTPDSFPQYGHTCMSCLGGTTCSAGPSQLTCLGRLVSRLNPLGEGYQSSILHGKRFTSTVARLSVRECTCLPCAERFESRRIDHHHHPAGPRWLTAADRGALKQNLTYRNRNTRAQLWYTRSTPPPGQRSQLTRANLTALQI